ncbi:MAG: hypothetical protein ACT4PL_03240 [Phycisphaerales bacterium]
MNRITLLTLAASIGCASLAHADTISMNYTGQGKGSSTKIHFGNAVITAFTGQLKHTLSNGTGAAALLNGQRTTFCVDLAQVVSQQSNTFDVVAPSVVTNAISPSLGAARAQALNDLFSTSGVSGLSSTATNSFGTAFQLLVWEIIYDYNPTGGLASLNLTVGNVRFTKTNNEALSDEITTQFESLKASIGSGSATLPGLFAIRNAGQQDQLVFDVNRVPAPGAAALLGLSGLLLARRRRSAT